MDNLNTIKNQLKERLPKEGITPVLKVLKELLPEHSPKRNSFLQLEADYKALKMQFIDGVISQQDYSLAENKIRKRLIEFIDSLEVDDFNVNLKRSRLREDNKIKQGHVLYRIPRQMQVRKEVKCIVRIALDEVTLVKKFEVDEHTKIESEVRVSDYMKVLLIDPAASPAFAIRTTNTDSVQFIDADAPTEWKFYVTPLIPGEHVLELKVIVMEIINGVERVRETSLEENVVIVTEAVPEEMDAPLQSADINVNLSDTVYALEKAQSNFRLPKAVRTAALVLAALMVVSTATFAFIPPVEQRWLVTRYWYDTPEAYEQFINENPSSERVDDASFRKAKLRQSPQELQQFIETFDNKSEYIEQAKIELQKLEEKAWQEVKSVSEPAVLQDFIKTFPKGKRADDATWRIAEITQTPEALQDYIEKFPEGEKAPIAQADLQQLEERTWQRVKTTNNRDSLQQFVKTFPTGRYAPEVQKVLQQAPPSGAGGQKTLSAAVIKQLQRIQPTVPVVIKEREKTTVKDTTVTKTENTTLPEQQQPVKEEPAKTEPIKTEEKTTQEPLKTEEQDADSPLGGRGAMVLVKGGTFQMGSNDGNSDERPVHTVTVSDFYISKYEVTFDEYDAFCDATKRKKPEDQGWGRGKRPVINVSWDDATAYCKWLSDKTGQKYRLPTEAEWEYAARGGAKSKGFKYSGSDDLDKVAWYDSNSKSKTQPVGGKAPNELGLYDMSGNVYEWVQDCWNDSYKGAPTNGSAWLKGDCSVRVIRGGSWFNIVESFCRVAYRYWNNYSLNYVGFRVVRD